MTWTRSAQHVEGALFARPQLVTLTLWGWSSCWLWAVPRTREERLGRSDPSEGCSASVMLG